MATDSSSAVPPLFHGTHSGDRLLYRSLADNIIDLGRNFTTHPGDALMFAFDMTKKYAGTQMVVIALPVWEPGSFRMIRQVCSLSESSETQTGWYRLSPEQGGRVYAPDSREQRGAKIFREDDSAQTLERFVNAYCTMATGADPHYQRILLEHYRSQLALIRENR